MYLRPVFVTFKQKTTFFDCLNVILEEWIKGDFMQEQQMRGLIAEFQTQLASIEGRLTAFKYTSELREYFKSYIVTELEKDRVSLDQMKQAFFFSSTNEEDLCRQYFFLEKHDYLLSISEIIDMNYHMREIREQIRQLTKIVFDRLRRQIVVHLKSESQSRITLESHALTGYDLSCLLNEIGIPSNLKGRQYIEYIMIELLERKLSIKDGITTSIYPMVASFFQTTPSKVERSIRHAVEVAWMRGNEQLLHELCGYTVSFSASKPTNREFLANLFHYLELKLCHNGIDKESFSSLRHSLLS